jgi:hypothetical protein
LQQGHNIVLHSAAEQLRTCYNGILALCRADTSILVLAEYKSCGTGSSTYTLLTAVASHYCFCLLMTTTPQIDAMAEGWSREQKDECLGETQRTFMYGGGLLSSITAPQ